MEDAKVQNSDDSLVLVVDHMEVGRTMIGVVHLDNDSVEPAYRRHGVRLPFEQMLVNFPVESTRVHASPVG